MTSREEGVASSRERPLAVGALIRAAGRALDGVGLCWVEGEVAQVARPASGHIYLLLRDRAAVVAAVIWKSNATRIRFPFEAGARVRVRGRLSVYDRDGKMQLYVDFAEPAGVGAAAMALEALKQALAAEGLFDVARKRRLPLVPRRIGVVTSASGAAIRDIVRTVERRFPRPILVADCAVQGPSAPIQIIHALRAIATADIDVLIVGRGGGAVTDLSAFNDERVVRAVAAFRVPTISAVGHEIDLTLCDLAADHRASTPTAAAEIAVPVHAELAARLAKEERRAARELDHRLRAARQAIDSAELAGQRAADDAIARARHRLAALDRRLLERHPHAQLVRRRAGLDALEARLPAAMSRKLDRSAQRFGALAASLDALSPLRVLDRGYALATKGAMVLLDAERCAAGDKIDVRLARGRLRCTVDDREVAS